MKQNTALALFVFRAALNALAQPVLPPATLPYFRVRYEASTNAGELKLGVTYNNPMWHFDVPTLFPHTNTWQQALDSPGARDIARMGKFFAELPWQELVPDARNTLIGCGAGEGAYRATAARSLDGRLVVIYGPAEGKGPWELTLDLLQLPAPCRAYWFNPAKDVLAVKHRTTLPHQDQQSLQTPGDNAAGANDWVLVLQAR